MKHAEKIENRRDNISSNTKVIWHKCNSTQKMLDAVEAAAYGVIGIEFDVMPTKDGVPVLFHDKAIVAKLVQNPDSENVWIEEKLEEPIEVSSLTLDQLHSLRPDIDTLEYAFKGVSRGVIPENFEFHLEIKPPLPEFWYQVKDVLKNFPQINSQTIPRSFQESVLQEIKKDEPERPICLLMGTNAEKDPKVSFTSSGKTAFDALPEYDDILDICGGNKPQYVSVNYNLLTQDFIDNMKASGVEVDVYTLNEYKGLNGLKVDRIVTDLPVAILSAIKSEERTARTSFEKS